MKTKLAKDILHFIAVSSALTKRALDEVAVHRTTQEKAASMRQEIVDLMIRNGTVGEQYKQAAAAMLGSHPETLSLLKMASEKIAVMHEQLASRISEMGQSVEPSGSEKTAYDSINDPYVGRRTSQLKQSDLALMRVLEPIGG